MKLSLLTLVMSALFSQAALADTLTCTFTEPFLTTAYNTATGTFTVYDPFSEDGSGPVEETGVQMKVVGDIAYELVSSSGVVIQKLLKSGKGSDGMSEIEYQFEVEWMKNPVTNGPLVGGCNL